jgi:hypothetical protein
MNINSYQIMFNLGSGATSYHVGIGTVDLYGGFSPDVTAQGSELRYRIRPRSSLTGARGNPSPAMRYGVRPSREGVIVPLPLTFSDPQVDTWDIFRIGGTLDADTFVGFVPIGTASFLDNFNDLSIVGSEQLAFDDLEPWPTVDNPFQGIATVNGTTAIVQQLGMASTYVGNYLPGNKVQIGEYVYTLWNRPTNISPGLWFMQFQENANYFPSGTAANIYEPLVANQMSRMTSGPTDDGGVVFGLDPLRPGTISYCKNFNPDSVPSKYNLELCPPSETLMGHCIFGSVVAVGSTARKWLLRPSFGQANQWTPTPLPGGGIASPFGICTDGKNVYAIEKNGITKNGESITDEDLSNLFPQDGVTPQAAVNGIIPPDFTKANRFRLSCGGGYLYFNYDDISGGESNTLVYSIRRGVWESADTRPGVLLHVPIIQSQSQSSYVNGAVDPVQLLMGDLVGNVFEEVDLTDDNGTAIGYKVITAEDTNGEERALKQVGDIYVSILPGLNLATTIALRSGGATIGPSVTVPLGSARVPVISNADNQILFSAGLSISGFQTYANGELPVTLYIWQPAYIPQPVVEQQRAFDWDDAAMFGNKFYQGFVIEANTNGVNKTLGIRDSEGFALHPFTPSPVNFARQSEQAFSFSTPFVAHSVRVEPQDAINWNFWKVRWVVEPYPEAAELWQTEGTTHGLKGFFHVRLVNLAYIATAPVTLTITTDTGFSIPLTFAATGAQLTPAKVVAFPTFNKGKVYSYSVASSAPFYCWKDLCEVWARAWGDPGPYTPFNLFGGGSNDGAAV